MPFDTTPPTTPNRGTMTEATFAPAADAYFTWFSSFATDMVGQWPVISATAANAAAAQAAVVTAQAAASVAAGATAYSRESATSVTVGTGAKGPFTVTSGFAFQSGDELVAFRRADRSVYMKGTLSGSTSTSLTLNVTSSNGSGTFTDWIIVSGVFASILFANAADLRTGTDLTKAVSAGGFFAAYAPVALTDSASITPDFGAGIDFTLTKATNGSLNNPTNAKVGQRGTITVTQDATGGRTMSFGSAWKREGGALALSTAAGAIDEIIYEVKAQSGGVATRIIYNIIRNAT